MRRWLHHVGRWWLTALVVAMYIVLGVKGDHSWWIIIACIALTIGLAAATFGLVRVLAPRVGGITAWAATLVLWFAVFTALGTQTTGTPPTAWGGIGVILCGLILSGRLANKAVLRTVRLFKKIAVGTRKPPATTREDDS